MQIIRSISPVHEKKHYEGHIRMTLGDLIECAKCMTLSRIRMSKSRAIGTH